jgi:SAM-dependent methyltransferase
MKNADAWQPTKYTFSDGRAGVGPAVRGGTWLIARLVVEAYARLLPEHARGRLVDLGCGSVPLYEAYRPLVSDIVCVDWAGNRHGRDHVDVEHDLNEPLPFSDGSFETALLSDVLEHTRHPATVLREIQRVLAPGGTLLLNVPFYYWLHEQPHDYFRFTEHGLRSLLSEAGFERVSVEGLGGAPEVMADMLGKHLLPLPVIGDAVARNLQKLVFAGTRPAWVRRALSASRQRFPLGYVAVGRKPDHDADGSGS